VSKEFQTSLVGTWVEGTGPENRYRRGVVRSAWLDLLPGVDHLSVVVQVERMENAYTDHGVLEVWTEYRPSRSW
jgi:hypothetical protein